MDEEQPLSKSSELCLACGLCCQGVLHDHAVLKDDELPLAVTLNLTVRQIEEDDSKYYAFQLPCPCYKNNNCTVYDRRPSPCSNYQCVVLKNFNEGTTNFVEAMVLIRQVKSLFRKVQSQLGQTDAALSIWQQVATHYERTGHDVPRSLPLEVKELWEYGYYHFDRKIFGLSYPYHES